MTESVNFEVKLTLDGKQLTGGVAVSRDAFRKLAIDAQRAGAQMAGGFSKAAEGVRSISSLLSTAQNALAGFFAVSGLRRAIDGFAELNARIGLIESSARSAAAAFNGVFAIAQKSGQDMGAIADVYARVGRNARALGLDQQGVLQTTTAVANAVRLSGASAASAQAALMQFGQALASGALRGDELNSIMEQTPALAEAIARGMGKTVGDLRKLGEEGRLTATEVIGALRNESARLEAETARMADTIGMSLTRLGNAWQKYLGENTSTATRATATAINTLADNLDKAAAAALALGAGFAAAKLAGWVSGLGGVAGALLRINPVTAGIGLAVTALAFAFKDFQRGGEQAAEGVRSALARLAADAGRMAADLRGMTVQAVGTALADLERQRAVLVASLTRTRQQWDALRERRLGDRNEIRRRDRLGGEVLGGENELERLNKEIDGIRANLSSAGRRDIDAFFDKFGSKASKTRQELQDLEAATRKAIAAAQGTTDPAGAIRRIQAEAAAKRSEILATGKAPKAPKADTALEARVPGRAAADTADLDALQAGLKTSGEIIDTALAGRLISYQQYYQAKAALQARAAAAERERLDRELAAQNDYLANLQQVKPINAVQQAALAERLAAARIKANELQAALDALDGREVAARFSLEIAGAQAAINEVENRWRQALDNMRQAQDNANVLRDAGALTAAQAQERIRLAAAEAQAALATLLPQFETALAALFPPEEVARRMENLRTQLVGVQAGANALATQINGAVQGSFATMFEQIGTGAKSAKEAFADFARSVLAALARIAAQKLAERVFGAFGRGGGGGAGGGVGGFLAKALGFASGGTVPGSGHGDSVPAMLTPGEFVIRKAAVRRFGVHFLSAINGLRMPPTASAGRLAFAAGGLVPAPQKVGAGGTALNLSIVNSIDPAITHDHLQTPDGMRTVVNVISKNAGAIRQALGV